MYHLVVDDYLSWVRFEVDAVLIGEANLKLVALVSAPVT